MTGKLRQVLAAIWQYLNQPVFNTNAQSVWQPSHFWYRYQIQFLEACWQKDVESESHYTQ
jgi:hypothetical protein